MYICIYIYMYMVGIGRGRRPGLEDREPVKRFRGESRDVRERLFLVGYLPAISV